MSTGLFQVTHMLPEVINTALVGFCGNYFESLICNWIAMMISHKIDQRDITQMNSMSHEFAVRGIISTNGYISMTYFCSFN